jgi:hypothetical protein
MSAPLQCPACHAGLREANFNQLDFRSCPACNASVMVDIFPALFRPASSGPAAEALVTESDASCFYHEHKKAVRPCEGCGRFVCALCDCELHGQHFCPQCIESGRTKGKIKSLDSQRTRYDSIALALAIYPLLIFYLTIITAPMTLFVAIRYWKSPPGILRRSKFRFVLAIILALLQIFGWMAVLIAILTAH